MEQDEFHSVSEPLWMTIDDPNKVNGLHDASGLTPESDTNGVINGNKSDDDRTPRPLSGAPPSPPPPQQSEPGEPSELLEPVEPTVETPPGRPSERHSEPPPEPASDSRVEPEAETPPQPEAETPPQPPAETPAEQADATKTSQMEGPKEELHQENHNGDVQAAPFSWLDAHSAMVIILVGPDGSEQAFAIQKNFICSKSAYFRDYFRHSPESLENVVKFPDVTPETFGFVQNFLYTAQVYPSIEHLPSYEVLINIWKLANRLGINELCNKALEAMEQCRQITQHIPATPLLVQVWNETPEGSTIRQLLLGWAAEYMRSSDARAEFAKSLPKEVLSELVVAMSSLDMPPPILSSSEPPMPPPRQPATTRASPLVRQQQQPPPSSSRKNVHYREAEPGEDEGEYPARGHKKAKRVSYGGSAGASTSSAIGTMTTTTTTEKKTVSKKASRQNLVKQPKRRSSASSSFLPGQDFTTDKKLDFCADLLTRMLSGPGFWTRLVGPFKYPVQPAEDGVPDYYTKVKRPMDLGTIKAKMDSKEYVSEREFAGDVRQIFHNCYTYWTDKDPMWATCIKFEKTFEEKFAEMNKWLGKMSGHEGDDHT